MATAQPTIDHDAIRTWVEERGGHPARVKATGTNDDPGILRIDFPGFSGEDSLEEIGWDEFFEWFDRNNLAALLSDEEGNRFNKLIDRSGADLQPGAGGGGLARVARAAKRAVSRLAPGTSGSSRSGTKSKRTSSTRKSTAATSSSTKSAAKKIASRSATKKSTAKKSAAKKSTAKKSAAKKSTAKKSTAKKSTAKRATSKSASAKRTSGATKRTTARNSRSTGTKRASRANTQRATSSQPRSRSGATASKRTSAKKASSKRKTGTSITARKSATSRSSGRTTAKRSSDGSRSAVTTTNHNEIRRWVEERGGFPAHVKRTGRKQDPGVLRIDYPGFTGTRSLERISWDEWFDWFDRNDLAFLYQNKKNSRFSKLVSR